MAYNKKAHLLTNTAAIRIAFGVIAIPQSYLIDPQGIIIAKNLRGDGLLDYLKELFE